MEKNAQRNRKPYGLTLFLVMALAITGCKRIFGPTYPGAKLAESVVALCAKDYKRDVQARRTEGSLQIMCAYSGNVESALTGIDKAASDVLEDILQAATRVALSTDEPPQFVEVFLRNPGTGATFGIWRYVDDMRRFMHTDLPTLESIERMVLVHDEVQEGEWPRPVTLTEFLARQVVQRVKRQAGVEAHEDLSEPNTLGIVLETWPLSTDANKDGKTIEALGKATKVVIDSYRFREFTGIHFKDSNGDLLKRWPL